MAHEIAHVTEKHSFRRSSPLSVRSSSRNWFLRRPKPIRVISDASSLLIVQSFSQEYEFEADKVGWNYVVAAA